MIVESDHRSALDPENEGKLVYIKGHIKVNEPLCEPEYGVTINAVKLERRVEMYQWVELHENTSWWQVDKSHVSYTTQWTDQLVDSSLFVNPFGHENPKSFPVHSEVSVSDFVQVGPFNLSQELKHRINEFTLLKSDQQPERQDIKMHSGFYYHVFDVWNPEVGDTRVQLSYAGPANQVVTILARQEGSTLRPYYFNSEEFTFVFMEEVTLTHILSSEFPPSNIWQTRMFAYSAFFFGYSLIMKKIFNIYGTHWDLDVLVIMKSNIRFLSITLSIASVMAITGLCRIFYSPVFAATSFQVSLILMFYFYYKFKYWYLFSRAVQVHEH